MPCDCHVEGDGAIHKISEQQKGRQAAQRKNRDMVFKVMTYKHICNLRHGKDVHAFW